MGSGLSRVGYCSLVFICIALHYCAAASHSIRYPLSPLRRAFFIVVSFFKRGPELEYWLQPMVTSVYSVKTWTARYRIGYDRMIR